ncbi:hypothetical protein UCDDS831_g06549 [Diplodia seriata]|uniref:Uncharacterized protein n=1 Tax=Diplodia seriata TaxID=420778 RepID=A0A0G2E2V0_9PEZI|nr:hypothetical protein UCDDS831_g06549 [Diplodia seriata]
MQDQPPSTDRSTWKHEAIRRGNLRITGPPPADLPPADAVEEDQDKPLSPKRFTDSHALDLRSTHSSTRRRLLRKASLDIGHRVGVHSVFPSHKRTSTEIQETIMQSSISVSGASTVTPTTIGRPSKRQKRGSLSAAFKRIFGSKRRLERERSRTASPPRHAYHHSEPQVRRVSPPRTFTTEPRVGTSASDELPSFTENIGRGTPNQLPFPMNVNAPQEESSALGYIAFNQLRPIHRRRATLPSMVFNSTDASTLSAVWSESASRHEDQRSIKDEIGIATSHVPTTEEEEDVIMQDEVFETPGEGVSRASSRDTVMRASSPRKASLGLPPPSSHSYTEQHSYAPDQMTALYSLLYHERAARKDLETQVDDLRREMDAYNSNGVQQNSGSNYCSNSEKAHVTSNIYNYNAYPGTQNAYPTPSPDVSILLGTTTTSSTEQLAAIHPRISQLNYEEEASKQRKSRFSFESEELDLPDSGRASKRHSGSANNTAILGGDGSSPGSQRQSFLRYGGPVVADRSSSVYEYGYPPDDETEVTSDDAKASMEEYQTPLEEPESPPPRDGEEVFTGVGIATRSPLPVRKISVGKMI